MLAASSPHREARRHAQIGAGAPPTKREREGERERERERETERIDQG